MKKRVISLLAAGALMLTPLLGGCGILIEEEDTGAVPVNSTSKMMSGQYYVWHNENEDDISNNLHGAECETNVFSPVYRGNYTFVGKENSLGYEGDKTRIIWALTEDLPDIPTLYAGDKLIYYDVNYMPESFFFERFSDEGDTFGVAGLYPLKSGRYAYSFSSNMLFEKSDMARIAKLSQASDTVIFDKISTVQITPDIISDAGLIQGMEPGETYDFNLYAGTVEYGASIAADSRAFVSMEGVETYEYSLPEAEIAIIEIPDYLKTGYYFVNGTGLFRYVNGTSYDEKTDFNDPMFIYGEDGRTLISAPPGYMPDTEIDDMTEPGTPEDINVPDTSTDKPADLGPNEVTETFEIPAETAETVFRAEYKRRDEGSGIVSTPTMTVTGPDGTVHSAIGSDGALEVTVSKPAAGKWEIKIKNASHYNFSITSSAGSAAGAADKPENTGEDTGSAPDAENTESTGNAE